MKKMTLMLSLLLVGYLSVSGQTAKPALPVKTGDEWKMPSDLTKRSRAFADGLQKKLGLDSNQTRKVYEAFLANGKPLDEIRVMAIGDKEKAALIKNNKAAFDAELKPIFSVAQFREYQKMNLLW